MLIRDESMFYSGQSVRLAMDMGLFLDAGILSDDDEGDEETEAGEEAISEATF